VDAISPDPFVRRRLTLFGLVCLTTAAFFLGLWIAFTPPLGPIVKPIAGGVLIVCGLALLSPFATSTRAMDDRQRCARKALSAMGVGNILAGASQLAPGTSPQAVLLGLSAGVMAITWGWMVRANRAARSTPSTTRPD
jgi:hypothetical protein